ncbi:hypothetical protein E2542_SST16209 [Spatholobus suberectus]|nr:hypothetical protein E2542_SST16209 [Spatholobus suberectus]
MVIHRLELCIAMVRMAIEFVMNVAETVVIVQQRTVEPLGSLNRAKAPPFGGGSRELREDISGPEVRPSNKLSAVIPPSEDDNAPKSEQISRYVTLTNL